MDYSNMSAEELINVVTLSDSSTKLDKALASKLSDKLKTLEDKREIFQKVADIVDLEL